MKPQQLLYYLRRNPFPNNSIEGRSAERYRRVILTTIANIGSRCVGLVLMIVSVSWTLPYLGAERFGAWMTIASFAVLIGFLDLGIGNALTNRVAYIATTANQTKLRKCISGGLGLLGLISITLASLLFFIGYHLPWSSIMKLGSMKIESEVKNTVLLFTILFALSTFSNGIAKVFHGLQLGYESHIAILIGSSLGLVGLFFASQINADLPLLLLCTTGGPILGNLCLVILLYKRGQVTTTEAINSLPQESKHLIKSGALFFLLQIGVMVAFGADPLIIANATGTESVAAFSIMQRLTQFISQPVAIMNAPLWAAYADASFRGDRNFIKSTLKKSLIISFSISTIGAVLIVLFGSTIITEWTNGKVTVEKALIFAMALWLIFEVCGNSFGIMLNGLGIIRQQVWVATAFIVIALPLKFWLGNSYGALGVVSAGLVAYFFTTILGYAIMFRKDILEKLNDL